MTMKALLFSLTCLLVVVCGQPGFGEISWPDIWNALQHRYTLDIVEVIDEYRFVEHNTSTHHILIAIKDTRDNGGRQCYIVGVDKYWEYLLSDQHTTNLIVDEIYHIIIDHKLPDQTVTLELLENTYHDIIGTDECDHHTVHMINYVPSMISTTGPVPTQSTVNGRPIG